MTIELIPSYNRAARALRDLAHELDAFQQQAESKARGERTVHELIGTPEFQSGGYYVQFGAGAGDRIQLWCNPEWGSIGVSYLADNGEAEAGGKWEPTLFDLRAVGELVSVEAGQGR